MTDMTDHLSAPTIPDSAVLDEARVRTLASSLNLNDSKAVLSFGTEAQKKVTQTADALLESVQNKDSGAGSLLTSMVLTLKGFSGAEAALKKRRGLLDRLFGAAEPMIAFKEQFKTVSEQIDSISTGLEQSKQALLIDITALDRLYDAALDYFRDLEHHSAAAERVLRNADNHSIPALQSRAAETGSIADAQRLRDFQGQRDELERRLHDLRLTRQVTMQALPGIRLIQDNDKSLVNKINSMLINTVPLWRQQLAQTIALHKSQKTAAAVKAGTDLTNELLTQNADILKQSTHDIRTETERGIFDIENIEAANRSLIAALEESVQLTEDGKRRRQDAEARLQQAEAELKKALQNLSQPPK